jgi:hypothetical protein
MTHAKGAEVFGIGSKCGGSVFCVCVGIFVGSHTPSKIADFHPTTFKAKADKSFFYSIGDELRHSDELSVEAPTLLRGGIGNFLVSPDETKIAVVANKLLMVVGKQGTVIRQVASVDSIYRGPKPIGQRFYRYDNFQWSRDLCFPEKEFHSSMIRGVVLKSLR